MATEYQALVAKVDAFTSAAALRRADDMRCASGCSSCCSAWLSVTRVEADQLRQALARLSPVAREVVRARGLRELEREARKEEPRCALLDEGGLCTLYEARPLVCRTQGHALRYPRGFIPVEAVTRKTTNGDLTWCPLNYHRASPDPEDVLDAERVDQILAVVAERYSQAHESSRHGRHERHRLSALAAERDVLHDRSAHDDEFENA